GSRSYALHPNGTVGMVSLRRGTPLFEVRDLQGGKVTQYAQLQKRTARIDDPVAFSSGFAALISRPTAAPAIMRMAKGGFSALTALPRADIESGFISKGEVREFRRPDGQAVYGIHYAPKSATHRGPAGAAPPALVFVHGGPTS